MVVSWLPCILSCFSRVQHFVTPWTVARKTPLSMEFSRQEYWNGLPIPSPGDLFDPGIESTSHYVFCTDRRILYPGAIWDTQTSSHMVKKTVLNPALCLLVEETIQQVTQTLEAHIPGRADVVHLLDVSGGHPGTVGEDGLPSRECTFLPAILGLKVGLGSDLRAGWSGVCSVSAGDIHSMARQGTGWFLWQGSEWPWESPQGQAWPHGPCKPPHPGCFQSTVLGPREGLGALSHFTRGPVLHLVP